ncbi:heparinase II/III family protein [Vibrio diabolicus]|uniref:heparinase II/III domain-containing protein n=1 Tax=Vibrio TaxID=662 RepID=UPI0013DEB42B|nr:MULTISPECIES: heparinase II/III family protein [Vibrio]MDW2022528.1 heparinase II/III family protein [Vibrio sp. 397]MDW2027491.1 heparinase II/III family protein [Vibrio sp. 399]MDW2213669.1 heparinase II/III family protein [Vibrio sp. 1982]QOV30130.1 heparinase II/III family protein [Vibrio diabolicus]
MLAKTKWYVNRLKKMSFLEVIHRCYEQLVFSRIKLLFKLGILPSFYKENNTAKKFGKANFSHLDDYFYDGLNNESLDDIYTCLNETETILFTNVNYRIADDNFDIRNFWEKHRFQQLVSLSRNGSISKAELVGFVKEWSERNPPYIGKNYVSVMEVALRVISLLVANYYIDRFDEIKSNSKDDTFLNNFYNLNYKIISERLSLYSSAGNHTLTELCALIIIASISDKKRDWARFSDLFSCEFLRQTYQDGGSKEQATWYLKFIHDLAIIVQPFLSSEENRNLIAQRISSIRQYLESVSQFGLEKIGDSDSGFALAPNFGFKAMRGDLSDINGKKEIFRESGFLSYESHKYSCLFNFSSLGMAPCYGHGHLDALSLLVNKDGKKLFTDIGTYSYNSSEDIRSYFRSNLNHNTVSINKKCHAKELGKFMWDKPYFSVLLDVNTTEIELYSLAKLEFSNDLKPFTAYRAIYIHDEEFAVLDFVYTSNHEEFEVLQTWVLGEDVNAVSDSKGFLFDDEMYGLYASKGSSVEHKVEQVTISNTYLEKSSSLKAVVTCRFKNSGYVIISNFNNSKLEEIIKMSSDKIKKDNGFEF